MLQQLGHNEIFIGVVEQHQVNKDELIDLIRILYADYDVSQTIRALKLPPMLIDQEILKNLLNLDGPMQEQEQDNC